MANTYAKTPRFCRSVNEPLLNLEIGAFHTYDSI